MSGGPRASAETHLRVLDPRDLRAAADVGVEQARRAWAKAMRHDGDDPVLVALLDDWSRWSGLDYPDMLRAVFTAQDTVDREWEAASPGTPESAAAFYDQTDTIVPLLLWWHATTPGPARSAATAASVFGAVGVRRVLDFGGGIGSTSLALAAGGIEPVIAEVSGSLLDLARWRFERRGRALETVDLRSETLGSLAPGSFDGAISFDVFEHIPNVPEALGSLDRLLRPAGVLCFNQVFVPEDRDEPQHYPQCGETLVWLHDHGYRLAHATDVGWVAQKAPLDGASRARQALELRARIGSAKALRGRRGPIGRRVAFHTIRHALG
jgi:SAM-dependent methyltransferase